MTRRGAGGYHVKPVPRTWQWSIADYLNSLNAVGQRSATVALRNEQLRALARAMSCPPENVNADMLTDYFGRQSWSPEMRRSNRSAVKGFYSWMYKAGRVNVYLGDAIPTVFQPKATPRPAADDAWESAMSAAHPRERLMLRLAAEAGLRRAEVAQVRTSDAFISYGAAQLVINGKGGKQRIVPISDDLAEAIRRGAAGHTPGTPSDGWLFANGFGGHLTAKRVGDLVSALLPKGVTMHALRHRFASRAYRGTRNLRAVQTLLGHASIATTERYTQIDDHEMRAAMMAAL